MNLENQEAVSCQPEAVSGVAGKYQPYPEYKDSGTSSLGVIPHHWSVQRVNHLFSFGRGLNITKANLEDSGIPCVSYGEVHSKYGFEVDPERHSLRYVNESYLSFSPRSLLSTGDFVFADTSEDIDGAGNFTQFVGKGLLFAGYHTVILRSKLEHDPRYLAYAFDAVESRSQIRLAVKGVKVFSITQEILKNVSLVLPTYSEQRTIAAFLDHETARIDALIAKQQRLIALLKEKRQAVISHAVTKGLNQNAPMKDSGVEWLGQVPAHWRLPKLLHVTSRVGDGLHATPIYEDGTGYFFVNGNNLSNGEIKLGLTSKEVPESEYQKHYITLDETTVLMSINGTVGNLALYNLESVILGKSACYINCKSPLNRQFLMTYLRSDEVSHYFDIEVTGTTIFNLSLNSIRQMRVCVPPMAEQKIIVEYCQEQDLKFGKLIDKADQAITLIQERRTALISAAVTGKIDVRGWQPPAGANEAG